MTDHADVERFRFGHQRTQLGLRLLANAIMPSAQFGRRMEALIDEIHAAPLAEGATQLRVPGEIEWERYDDAMRKGIQLPEDVVTNVRKATDMAGLSPAWLT